MTEIMTRELLFEMAAKPIGSRKLQGPHASGRESLFQPEAIEAAKRANKRWLPNGKITASSLVSKEKEMAFYANQIDLEDAVEAAGGQRGSSAA